MIKFLYKNGHKGQIKVKSAMKLHVLLMWQVSWFYENVHIFCVVMVYCILDNFKDEFID